MNATTQEPAPNPVKKLVIELGPLAAFFIANRQLGIVKATGVFMIAIVISLALSWMSERKVPLMLLVTTIVVLVFGGLTIVLDDAMFIKLKPTIVNTLFASVLLGGLAFKKSLLQPLLDSALKLDGEGWRILTLRFGFFFVGLALLNELVWRTTSDDFWVNFKVFGIMPITMVFMICQAGLIKRHELKSEGEPS